MSSLAVFTGLARKVLLLISLPVGSAIDKIMGIEAISNYLRVSNRIASSGQPEDKQFKYIAEAGYEVVINLAMANSEHAIPEEGNIVTAYNMSYVHIPVPFDAPTIDQLRKFMRVMVAFSDQMLWVHCVANYRASAFLYQYQRLVNGKTAMEAATAILPSWQPNDVWQRFMALKICI